MEKKFNIGDRVRHTKKGFIGTVTSKSKYSGLYGVHFDHDILHEYSVWSGEIEFENPKLAFLSELKGLLEKYDARIGCNPVRDDDFEICIDFKDSMISYPSYIQWLTAGYISHFKKD